MRMLALFLLTLAVGWAFGDAIGDDARPRDASHAVNEAVVLVLDKHDGG